MPKNLNYRHRCHISRLKNCPNQKVKQALGAIDLPTPH